VRALQFFTKGTLVYPAIEPMISAWLKPTPLQAPWTGTKARLFCFWRWSTSACSREGVHGFGGADGFRALFVDAR
jgi:hypothetical protein